MGYLLVLVIIVLLVVDISKKSAKPVQKSNNNVASSVPNDQPVAVEQTPEEKMAAYAKQQAAKQASANSTMNILLYAGSFLLVSAMLFFIAGADVNYVGPSVIIITLVAYLSGLLLNSAVPYLKPAAKAFNYTAIIIILFWPLAFYGFHLDAQLTAILTASVGFLASIVSAIAFNSKSLGFATFAWLYYLLIALFAGSNPTTEISFYVASIVTAVMTIGTTLVWRSKPTWLPVCFRKSVQILSLYIFPVMTGLTAVTLEIMSSTTIMKSFPWLATIMMVTLLLHSVLFWLKDKSCNNRLRLRFVAQAFVLVLVSDIFYSPIFGGLWYSSATANGTLARSIILGLWAATFIIQNLISLFAVPKTKAEQVKEDGAAIASIVGVALTISMSSYLSIAAESIVDIIVCIVLISLGIIHVIAKDGIKWSSVSLLGLFALPYFLGNLTGDWKTESYMIAYTIITWVVIAAYYFLRKYQAKDTLAITMASVGFSNAIAMVAAAGSDHLTLSIGLLFLSSITIAAIARSKVLMEVSVYLLAWWACALAGDALKGDSIASVSTRTGEPSTAERLMMIDAHIIAGSLLFTSFWKEREFADNKMVRLILAYAALSFGTASAALTSGSNTYRILFLFEQVVILVIGVFWQKEWMRIASIICIIMAVLSMSDNFYLWLAFFGATLIGVVIWRLSAANKQQNGQDVKDIPVVASPVSAVNLPEAKTAPASDEKAPDGTAEVVASKQSLDSAVSDNQADGESAKE